MYICTHIHTLAQENNDLARDSSPVLSVFFSPVRARAVELLLERLDIRASISLFQP